MLITPLNFLEKIIIIWLGRESWKLKFGSLFFVFIFIYVVPLYREVFFFHSSPLYTSPNSLVPVQTCQLDDGHRSSVTPNLIGSGPRWRPCHLDGSNLIGHGSVVTSLGGGGRDCSDSPGLAGACQCRKLTGTEERVQRSVHGTKQRVVML